MNDERRPPDGDDVDTGTPIPQLRDLDMPVSESFLETIRRKIERRTTANHFLDLFWSVPAMVILEFVTMLFEMVAPTPPKGGSQ